MKINDELPRRLIVTQVMFRRSRFDGASLTGQVAQKQVNIETNGNSFIYRIHVWHRLLYEW